MKKLKLTFLILPLLINSCYINNQTNVENNKQNTKYDKNQESVPINKNIDTSLEESPVPSPIPSNSTIINEIKNEEETCPKPNPNKVEPFKDFYSFNNAISLKGQIYDTENNFLNEANVSAKVINTNIKWENQTKTEINGSFIFKDAPTGVMIEITVNKFGYKTKKRVEIIKTGIVCYNIYNFGGNDYPDDKKYALDKL